VFSFDDLLAAPGQTTAWDGVRNYQARNYLRDAMRVGDGVLFYHSNAEPAGVAGTAEVTRAGYPEPEAPWVQVDVRAVARFAAVVTLAQLRAEPALADLMVLRRGNRLSVTPVTAAEWRAVCRLGRLG
jgi:predicted RNA-binding protein with PUA-like domain